jgi:ABC-type transporter lipoprotein component MlaA
VNYITEDDIRDDLLTPLLTAADVSEANSYLYNEALRYGAKFIAQPPTYQIKRLAVCKCLELIAGRKALLSPRTMSSSDGLDAYEIKRRAYAKERKEITDSISARDFTGATEAENPSISLYRA